MAKLERLLNLMAALLESERGLTADEIRGRIEGYPDSEASFRRAFERDKDDLREMGVPIVLELVPTSDPPVEGYRIPKDQYYLLDPNLAPDELAALHLAADVVGIDSVAGAEALRKLGGAASSGELSERLASVPADPRLSALLVAVTERRLVSFVYSGESRSLEPGRLDLIRGRWYLSGFDRSRGGERHFRLDRIDSEIDISEPDAFERLSAPTGVRMHPWELGDAPPVLARLLVDPDQARWAAANVGEPSETRPDGSVVIEVGVTNVDAFLSFVLTFLDHAEVLGPEELRDSMIAWLTRLADSDVHQ